MRKTTVWHVCGTRAPVNPETSPIRTPKNAADQQEKTRADDGNRTRMTSLEGWSSAIELHPRDGRPDAGDRPKVAYRLAPLFRTTGTPVTPRMRQVTVQRERVFPTQGSRRGTRASQRMAVSV